MTSRIIAKDIKRLNQAVELTTETIKAIQENKQLEHILLNALLFGASSFYTGLEHLLKEKLKERGITMPQGDKSHKKLLDATFREEILPQELKSDLEGLAAVRHFARGAYGVKIKKELVLNDISRIPQIWESIRHNIEQDKPEPPEHELTI